MTHDYAAIEKRKWFRSIRRKELALEAMIISLVGAGFGVLLATAI